LSFAKEKHKQKRLIIMRAIYGQRLFISLMFSEIYSLDPLLLMKKKEIHKYKGLYSAWNQKYFYSKHRMSVKSGSSTGYFGALRQFKLIMRNQGYKNTPFSILF